MPRPTASHIPTPEQADAEVQRILSLTDEEVLAEARLQGIDPEAEAAKCRRMIAAAIARTNPL